MNVKLNHEVIDLDNEIQDILFKILEGHCKIEKELSEIKEEVKRNTIKLEIIEKDINIIAGIQTLHKVQNVRECEETNKLITEKIGLIKTALTNTKMEINEVKENIFVLKDMAGRQGRHKAIKT